MAENDEIATAEKKANIGLFLGTLAVLVAMVALVLVITGGEGGRSWKFNPENISSKITLAPISCNKF